VLDLLPQPTDRRLALRVTRDAQRQTRGGHPWLFDSSITEAKADGTCGDLAVVFDDRRRFLAIGLYDPTSPIRVRVLHHGTPRTIDDDFWAERVAAAIDRRATLLNDPTTTGYRIIHGENDQLPGLVVDRYHETAVVRLDTASWVPHLQPVMAALRGQLPTLERAVLRTSRTAADTVAALLDQATGEQVPTSPVLFGPPVTGPIGFNEYGLRFEADVERGQKTGHFLDQRDNRREVGRLAKGRSVLDVFCSTGGFTVHAAAGGAQRVHSIDASPYAIDAVAHHLSLNADKPTVAAASASATVGDAFEAMERLAEQRQRFELVVIDPPSFASKQADVDRALRAYGSLTGLGLRLLTPGGTLVQSSCSSRVPADAFYAAVFDAAARSGQRLRPLQKTGHAVDHPVGFPQGAYLKTLFADVA
jgi:23S rRNA (cytosine1962-C5)-methyltransferase